MASTRNRNTPGNYSLEEKQYKKAASYRLYPNSQYGYAYATHLPGLGLMPAQIPANQLSTNAIDTESFLFGINSTNLYQPASTFIPENKVIDSIHIFNRGPTYIPEPLVIQKFQRPFPIP